MAALGQDPGTPVIADDGGAQAPSPDPAPEPAPAPSPESDGGQPAQPSSPSSGGSGGSPTTSSSTYTPPPSSASSGSAPTGLSPAEAARRRAEAARKRKEQARKQRERRARERERRQAALLAKRTEAAREAGFVAFYEVGVDLSEALAAAVGPASPETPVSEPVTPEAPAPEPEPAESVSVEAARHEASAASPRSSTPSAMMPVLLGLLGTAVLLLGLAALPRTLAYRSALVARALEHRFEIGLLGTAVLASAAIGLVVSNLGG